MDESLNWAFDVDIRKHHNGVANMKYQMQWVQGNRRHWAFFDSAQSAAIVWRALLAAGALDIECLANPNRVDANYVTLNQLTEQ